MRLMCPVCGESHDLDTWPFVDDNGAAKLRLTCTNETHATPLVVAYDDPEHRRRPANAVTATPSRTNSSSTPSCSRSSTSWTAGSNRYDAIYTSPEFAVKSVEHLWDATQRRCRSE